MTLSGSAVSPASGTSATQFTFSTTYAEVNGEAPQSANVYVDGTGHPMQFVSGSNQTGALYQAALTLPAGNHTYYFVFQDSKTGWADPFAPSSYAGPSVSTAAAVPAGSVIVPSHQINPDFPNVDGDNDASN